ncbi:hypothetical protein KIN20_020195 [Parelaphostrongylus tenuis]|uniref:Nucleotide-diphospho-sugar transferase domain-containing protein n=1 Tax=Parelaphostrongylus tenuis TaxID=148309 RepID=A0AAD5N300_PARTN|nr:hypothetical protein KIN20_020195 [Parelaphostrongylus tenuis]
MLVILDFLGISCDTLLEHFQDLSNGPLVLKEGLAVGKSIVLGKKFEMLNKAIVSEKIQKKLKKSYFEISTKNFEEPPTLNKDFIKKFAEKAKRMSATRHLLYFTVVNGAFERLTVNWLCNTVIFKGLHDLVLIVSTSKSLCESVHSKFNEKLACMFMNLPGFEEDLDWGEQKYINFLTIRAQLMRMLIESSVRFVLIETDSTWFRDPIDLFINATVIDDADIVVPSKGYAPKGDNLGFSPMLVESTNTSIALFDEINRRLLGNDSLYDQDVLNELCSMQYHGVVCRIFAYSEIADGKWFHLNERVKNSMKPFIVNNNFYVGLQNKETRQALNGFWFLTKTGQCSTNKVRRALKKRC